MRSYLQVFLDAIGEDAGSSRRLGDRGIYEHRVLNRGHKGKDVDLVLLDERYERVPLPCHARAEFCKPAVEKSASRVVRPAVSLWSSVSGPRVLEFQCHPKKQNKKGFGPGTQNQWNQLGTGS